MNFNFKFFVFLSVLTISGCATRYTYKNTSLPETDISQIRNTKVDNGWRALFSDYADLSDTKNGNDSISLGDHFIGFSSKMNFLPGLYWIRFRCVSGSVESYPSATVELKKGTIYSARCFNAVENKVGVEIKESTRDMVDM